MYNGVLGGFSHSKLFMEVRERASLAYTAFPRMDTVKGVQILFAGIDVGKFEQARDIMLRQLDDVREGKVTDSELEATRKALVNGLRSGLDDPGQIIHARLLGAVGGRQWAADGLVAAVGALHDDIAGSSGCLDTVCGDQPERMKTIQIEVREIPVRGAARGTRLPYCFVLPRRVFKQYALCHALRLSRQLLRTARTAVCVDGIAHFLSTRSSKRRTTMHPTVLRARRLVQRIRHTCRPTSSRAPRFKRAGHLLNFVLEPYFSPANIEKERGIIEQELLMYDDMPDRRVILALLEALYHEHPVRVDIGGTVQSIREVTAELLTACYDTFYHPENMSLVVLGDVEPVRVIEQVAENVDRRGFAKRGAIERIFPAEPPQVQGDGWRSR